MEVKENPQFQGFATYAIDTRVNKFQPTKKLLQPRVLFFVSS